MEPGIKLSANLRLLFPKEWDELVQFAGAEQAAIEIINNYNPRQTLWSWERDLPDKSQEQRCRAWDIGRYVLTEVQRKLYAGELLAFGFFRDQSNRIQIANARVAHRAEATEQLVGRDRDENTQTF